MLCLLAAAPALAVDLFVKPAGSGTTCVQSSPCTLATALATANADDAIRLAAGVYTSTGTEVVLLDKTVSLLGGWSGSPSGAVVRDPVAYESILDGEYARRVVKITAGAPTLDGLTIRRGNASGLSSGCASDVRNADGCGGGLLVVAAGANVIGNAFFDNIATSNAANSGAAGYGGAIHTNMSTTLHIIRNTFRDNMASTESWGYGGALDLAETSGSIVVAQNRFAGNLGTTKAGMSGCGGAVAVRAIRGPAALVEANLMIGNIARATPLDSSTSSDGNAAYLRDAALDFRENVITSDAPGFAVFLYGVAGDISGNAVNAGSDNASMFFGKGWPALTRVWNNVLVGGSGATFRAQSGALDHLSLELANNTIVNSGSHAGVRISDNTTAVFTNNIVAGHGVGIEVTGNGSVLANRTLFHNNADDGIRGTNPIFGDPRFVNPPAGDFHIKAGSAAIGAGVDAGVEIDIDGEARPGLGGIDVGADELAPRRFDFGTATSPVTDSYTQVTHATTFSPERGFGWTYGTVASRDRGAANNDLRRDLCFATTANFGVTLPNGRYRVTVTMGDAAAGHGQMAVRLETVKVATVSTAGNEFKELTLETAVADGRLDVWLNDEGGADPNVVINALAIEPALPVMVDLGTPASPLAPGYTRGTHATAYTPGAAFGWVGGIVGSRDRGTADPLRRDLVFTPRGLLGAFLANGIYDVLVTMGDAAGAHNLMGVSVQGAAFDQVSTARNQFVTRRYRTLVADNRLDVLLDDLEGPDVNTVLNAIEVRTPRPSRFDFGTPSSEVEDGWVQVTEKTLYADGAGYGWRFGTVASRDRGTGTALRRDLNFTREALFTADVLNGRYQVTITMGDTAGAHDQTWLALEGSQVATVSTAKGEFHVETFTVTVTDGTLDLAIEDWGGADLNAVINALEVR
jgi:fibronectin type 3 domain-containing protein